MKKKIVLLIAACFIFSGCNNINKLNTNQILYKDKILTYNENNIDDVFFENGIDITVNDENQVRHIQITNKDVISYNKISVGDKISKVKSKYQYEYQNDDLHLINALFDGNVEVDPLSDNNEGDNMWISYYYDDNGFINKILIYDSTFGQYLK